MTKNDVRNYFETHPDSDELHVTSDGQGFHRRDYAEDQSLNLSEKTITAYTREQVEGWPPDEDAPPPAETPAGTAPDGADGGGVNDGESTEKSADSTSAGRGRKKTD